MYLVVTLKQYIHCRYLELNLYFINVCKIKKRLQNIIDLISAMINIFPACKQKKIGCPCSLFHKNKGKVQFNNSNAHLVLGMAKISRMFYFRLFIFSLSITHYYIFSRLQYVANTY